MTGTFPRIRTVATGERSRRDKAWFRFLSWTISHTGETALAEGQHAGLKWSVPICLLP
jgi:hypothetical protein